MAQLQGFPSCCGAQILTGLYGPRSGATLEFMAENMPAKENFTHFTVAITNPSQHGDKEVVKALESRGFEQVLQFTGNGETQLHLWARGRNWKPLAGAKGNMKEQTAEEFEALVEKEVRKRMKKQLAAADLSLLAAQRVSRQPAGKKSQARRSTHGRGSTRSSRTETSA